MSENTEVLHTGTALAGAGAAMILIHGRGASAENILTLAGSLPAAGMAYLAPQAPDGAWYPQRFTAPLAANEPHLSNALDTVDALVKRAITAGVPSERILLVGFSQGACLVLEYAARNPRRYGAVASLSGGLIGPTTRRDYPGDLVGTPVLLGCSDVDFHIPLARVEQSADVLAHMGADVDKRIYPGMAHTINDDEIDALRTLVAQIAV